ncbi:hypothetical protein LOK49_LG09G00038 [Camellia lanceoleosa]|uniref:Uncharacterized protein n=1 Tax=Camellia lanceoleosa TaxID=1840588 RepID=A0ACC0GNV0_9ERIC|nr:hypothetical protein LOK49_LG09G00038 [Camellia lanceoleosa]
MVQKLQQQLKELGSKLENPPTTKDSLINLLEQAATCLSELDQSPTKSILKSMQPFLNGIAKPGLLKHQDREVALLVATCFCEITRITAPEAPYSDDVLKDIFHLIVSTFSGLNDTSGPSSGRRVRILETLARYRSCIVMLDLECDDLVNQMFSTFFSVASEDHSESVLTSMQTIMVVLLEESEDVWEDLLLVLLSVLGRNKSNFTIPLRRLAMNVIERCAEKLEPGVKQFLISSMSGDNGPLKSQIDYHEIIYDIYRCAPQILSGVVPYLTGVLLPGSAISETFQPIFSEFLKRLTDRVVEVECLPLNMPRVVLCQILSDLKLHKLSVRLLSVTGCWTTMKMLSKQVVAVICDVACHALPSIHSSMAPTETDDFDWIPGKILRCFYDKDFRSDTIEPILCGSLFPAEFSVKERVGNWIRVFSGFDKIEVKALEKILEQKQRLQQEMQRYLSLRQSHQDCNFCMLHCLSQERCRRNC